MSEYEKYRDNSPAETNTENQQQQGRRRCPAEFQLPSFVRHQILREECAHDCEYAQASNTQCTEAEISACIREVQKTKMQRRSSFALHETEHIQIFVESAIRKFRRLIQRCCNCFEKHERFPEKINSELKTETILADANAPHQL